VEERRNACRILVGTPEKINHQEVLHGDRRMILKWILEIRLEEWAGFIWLSIETSGGRL
jgi:hypothetical protein